MILALIIFGAIMYFTGSKNKKALTILATALLITALIHIQSIIMFFYMMHCFMFGHDCL